MQRLKLLFYWRWKKLAEGDKMIDCIKTCNSYDNCDSGFRKFGWTVQILTFMVKDPNKSDNKKIGSAPDSTEIEAMKQGN